MKVIKPPQFYACPPDYFSIFLGGSIEQDKAERWQDKLINHFQDSQIVFYNPRRDYWDASLPQDPTPGTEFHRQVTWEMTYQSLADLVIYYFDPKTISPITLLELGHHAPNQVLVCCPKDYFRYGNVNIFCKWSGTWMCETFEELIKEVNDRYRGIKN